MSRPENSQYSHCLSSIGTGGATALNLAAAVGLYIGYAVHSAVSLNRLSFLVTSAVTAGSVAGQVAFKRYPTYNSTAGSVAIGTLTIPNAAAVGQVYYKDVKYVQLNAGEELAILINVQAVDAGSASGQGFVGFSYEPAPDSVGDQTNMVLSA
jgi:hypothetical protein